MLPEKVLDDMLGQSEELKTYEEVKKYVMQQVNTRRPETDLSLAVNNVNAGNALGRDQLFTVDE